MSQPLDGIPSQAVNEQYNTQQQSHNSTYVQFMKPKFARAPIKEAGRVAYLGESSNLSILVHDRYGTSDVVHYPLPDNVRGAKARANDLDNMEIDILHKRGAFLLPPRALCDELVEAFFRWVAPVVPVINRSAQRGFSSKATQRWGILVAGKVADSLVPGVVLSRIERRRSTSPRSA
jgi:hypothetical protein